MSSAAAGAPLLAAKSLFLARGGRRLFADLSLEVCPGELWQIDGANGAGKTSLMRILCGLSRYGYEGEVQCAVPFLFLGHSSAVKALLSPRENLQLHPAGQGDPTAAAIESALASVGLQGCEDVPSHTLSAGQGRRINLARLYLSDAALWLLDEPFTAVDAAGIKALEKLFQSHLANGGAIVLSSHQPLSIAGPVRHLNLSPERLS